MLGFFIEKMTFLIYLTLQNMVKLYIYKYIYNMVDWKCLYMLYIPDTYKVDNRLSKDVFLDLQFKYRNGISKYLSEIIDFDSINEEIKDIGIPIVEDSEYNFYHRNSFFGNKYIYLRNNIHIERLNDIELDNLEEDKVDMNFYENTYKRVLYEDGDLVSYGVHPNDMNTKKSKAIVFEFAYDQKNCKSVSELAKIEECYEKIFREIKKKLDEKDIESDYLVYRCLPDIFKNKENNGENNL